MIFLSGWRTTGFGTSPAPDYNSPGNPGKNETCGWSGWRKGRRSWMTPVKP